MATKKRKRKKELAINVHEFLPEKLEIEGVTVETALEACFTVLKGQCTAHEAADFLKIFVDKAIVQAYEQGALETLKYIYACQEIGYTPELAIKVQIDCYAYRGGKVVISHRGIFNNL